ncbi:uncharacterized protein EI90DRAFT_3118603 [Cantharellus anzutake]|uniref:uncharacterized protein n=1 Tax=Cantharellus anzutake TaxID=1750568 RepID=UPI001903E2B2|nr:uncharacterized protein EI90DRAFT_3118603 [Cantharellus anzutake]KAF8338162.1 hypothetical protein EI90DRAFT_3118603 [Cantharellus anzutake]
MDLEEATISSRKTGVKSVPRILQNPTSTFLYSVAFGGMTDFTEKHSETLLNEPWRVKEDRSGTAYLFKFSATESGCCFLITDTKEVWVEALEDRHLYRRYTNRAPWATSADNLADNAWIIQHAHDLMVLHSPRNLEGVEIAVSPHTTFADLEVKLTSRHHAWKWECMRTAKLGATLLSQHLILPLITFNEALVSAAEPLSGMDETVWTNRLDGSAKASKFKSAVNVLFRQPRITTSLRRISQIVARVQSPFPVVSQFPLEDIEGHFHSGHNTEALIPTAIRGYSERHSSPLASSGSVVKKHVGGESQDSNILMMPHESRRGLSSLLPDASPPTDKRACTPRVMAEDVALSAEGGGSATEDEAQPPIDSSTIAAPHNLQQPASQPYTHTTTLYEKMASHEKKPDSEAEKHNVSPAPLMEPSAASGRNLLGTSGKGKRRSDSTEEEPDAGDVNDGTEARTSHASAATSRRAWQGPRRAVTKKKRF